MYADWHHSLEFTAENLVAIADSAVSSGVTASGILPNEDSVEPAKGRSRLDGNVCRASSEGGELEYTEEDRLAAFLPGEDEAGWGVLFVDSDAVSVASVWRSSASGAVMSSSRVDERYQSKNESASAPSA